LRLEGESVVKESSVLLYARFPGVSEGKKKWMVMMIDYGMERRLESEIEDENESRKAFIHSFIHPL